MGQVLLDSFEREEKFNESRERELVRRTENARTTNTAAVTSRSEQSRDKKKKKKELLFERFKESFEFFERFSTAGRSRFPPQNRGVGQKHKRSIGQKSAERRKRQKASLYSSEFEIRRTARAHYKPPLAHA